LAFHPYPQVIRTVFNPYRCGPPRRVTDASPCSWIDRPGFGSTPRHSNSPSAGLAFALVPWLSHLTSRLRRNSPDHNAKGTPSVVIPVAQNATSDRLLACGFRISFTPRTGVLFTCPSRYSSTIGHRGVFSLGGWSPQLPTGFLASRRTQELYYDQCISFAYRALTVCGPPFQRSSAAFSNRVRRSYNPGI
jgi:hypothetical protein